MIARRSLECEGQHPRDVRLAFLDGLSRGPDGSPRLEDLGRLFADVLNLGPECFDAGDALPGEL